MGLETSAYCSNYNHNDVSESNHIRKSLGQDVAVNKYTVEFFYPTGATAGRT